ncbi:LOW QUALITY PROTEIN: interferon-induced very large GTPase 1-like [Rhinophrynus dorsalis]
MEMVTEMELVVKEMEKRKMEKVVTEMEEIEGARNGGSNIKVGKLNWDPAIDIGAWSEGAINGGSNIKVGKLNWDPATDIGAWSEGARNRGSNIKVGKLNWDPAIDIGAWSEGARNGGSNIKVGKLNWDPAIDIGAWTFNSAILPTPCKRAVIGGGMSAEMEKLLGELRKKVLESGDSEWVKECLAAAPSTSSVIRQSRSGASSASAERKRRSTSEYRRSRAASEEVVRSPPPSVDDVTGGRVEEGAGHGSSGMLEASCVPRRNQGSRKRSPRRSYSPEEDPTRSSNGKKKKTSNRNSNTERLEESERQSTAAEETQTAQDRGEKRKGLIEMMINHKTSKLTLRHILDIGRENLNEVNPQTVEDLPWTVLRKLTALDRTARNTCLEENKLNLETSLNNSQGDLYDVDFGVDDTSKSIHPLDVLCVLLHCSDSFLQQIILSKMCMCQFAVPLLLPVGDSSHCTLMLWAMRDVVKRWGPQTIAQSKGFKEENVVKISMPIFSFVRLGKEKLSKSKVLNQVLSPTQQSRDFFIHENMEGGNHQRIISDGLVEISWYFPGGREKSDTFPEPIAVTNLRGDLESNWKQFSFLTQISSAVFIFAESINESEYKLISNCSNSGKSFYFIISPRSGKRIEKKAAEFLKKLLPVLNIDSKNILKKDCTANDAEIVKKIQLIMNRFLNNSPKRVKLEDMIDTANELGIRVDESCEECQEGKKWATEITRDIGDVVQYKRETMKLQGDLWKELSQTEKELCRMRKQGDKTVEEYRSELIQKRLALHKKQNHHELPDGMVKFITAVSQLSQLEKHYFLKWMKFTLDSIARNNLSELQAKYKESCKNTENNQDELKQLDQKISDSSLGVEHFLREMGQFYEAECSLVRERQIQPNKRQFSKLPGIAADLLLDGFPLELIDGDASNIPLQWVTDVLTELDTKTGGRCRMRVITVLGVQSTGKSTLLNTMFGLQFSVASGRRTRGAFMTLIKVKDEFQEELGCDFILVIDTEGLKAPELASLEDSYEHDNELATLVVGLSDITIVNMAMENTTEMRDTLQIVVHAFLRMAEIGKKPKCQFVHQNVSDVSAHENNMGDRNKLLEQLNEMTKVAAHMEKQNTITAFSDIMEYDLEKDNWYIPGLWYGVPPMASVNSGYSDNVYELKKYLFELIKKHLCIRSPQDIAEFIEWTKSLWNAVKHEKFIFSFRNSLIAEAYEKLAIKYSQWEWNFCKQVHDWLIKAEMTIKNQSADKLQNETRTALINDLLNILQKEEVIILDLLEKYFESKTDNVHLIERYREDFSRSGKCLRQELELSVISKIEEAIRIQKGKHHIQNIQSNYQKTIEEKVTRLLEEFRRNEIPPESRKVRQAFEDMWKTTLEDLPRNHIQKRNIEKEMLVLLKWDMNNKGGDINEKLINVKHLTDNRSGNFEIKKKPVDLTRNLVKKCKEWLTNECHKKMQDLAISLIQRCKHYVKGQENTKEDYNETFCHKLLSMISARLMEEDARKLPFTHLSELDIKLYILGCAAPRFQKMHEEYIQENDPFLCLEKLRPHYFEVFENIFQEKDESQIRAKQFCDVCLKPALIDHINKHLGKYIVDDINGSGKSKECHSGSYFQVHVLKKLLEEKDFNSYVNYIHSYEKFVKSWIKQYIRDRYEKSSDLDNLQVNILTGICKEIKKVLKDTELLKSPDVSHFLERFCGMLENKLVISQNEMKVIIFQNTADIHQFSGDIEVFLSDIEEKITSEIKSSTVESVLSRVTLRPEEELFKKVFGCGKQCPFCKVPCEVRTDNHQEHFASVHRPEGLGGYRLILSGKLITDICSTSVFSSNAKFRNSDTKGEWHLYKEYRTIYPDWTIQPDPSYTASDYWKFILTMFNEKFAVEYDANPADLPSTWKYVTEEQALQSLKEVFGMK